MNIPVDIENLRVAHWSPRVQLSRDSGRGLFLDTCLRQVYIDVATPPAQNPFGFGDRHQAAERRTAKQPLVDRIN